VTQQLMGLGRLDLAENLSVTCHAPRIIGAG
jgi:hypothetical protein